MGCELQKYKDMAQQAQMVCGKERALADAACEGFCKKSGWKLDRSACLDEKLSKLVLRNAGFTSDNPA